MKRPTNNLQGHFDGFLPDLEPGELEASWQVVKPHLPVRKRRAGLWLAIAAGVVALVGIIDFTKPEAGEDSHSALTRISPVTSPAEGTAGPHTTQAAESSEPPSATAHALQSSKKSPVKVPLRNSTIPARGSLALINDQVNAATDMSAAVYADPELPAVSENSGQAVTEGVHIDSLRPDVLQSRMLLPERGNDEILDASVTAIARPQPWSHKTAVTIFAGPLVRSTDYSSGNSGILPGWSAGLALERGLGRKWMVYLSAHVSDEVGSYSEREEYYQEIQPAKIPLTTGGPTSNGVPRYISVSDQHKVTPLPGYQAGIGAGFAVFTGPRSNVNLLLGAGIRRLQYKPEWNRVYGEDTLLYRPASTAVPTGPASATFFSANPIAGESDNRITSFYVNPGVRFLYRINHRLAFVSQLMFHAPIMSANRLKRSDAQLSSVWASPAPQLQPLRARDMMLHFGLSFRL